VSVLGVASDIGDPSALSTLSEQPESAAHNVDATKAARQGGKWGQEALLNISTLYYVRNSGSSTRDAKGASSDNAIRESATLGFIVGSWRGKVVSGRRARSTTPMRRASFRRPRVDVRSVFVDRSRSVNLRR
jgi:hypothetical protein